jgi:hypothetical protein
LKYFDKYTKNRSIERYRILIFDGHGSHRIVQFVIYVYKYNIVLIYLSPHSIYCFQPLDVAVFDLLIKYYFDIVKEKSRYEERGVSKREWVNWILEARKIANKKSNRKAVWEAIELISFNPNSVFKKLKHVKIFISRFIISQEQSNQSFSESVFTPLVRVQ